MNVALWLYSWFMGRLPILIALGAIVGGFWWYGHTRYNAGEAAVQARWDAYELEATKAASIAQAAADAALARQKQATIDAATRFQNEQVENVRLAGVNAALADRLRDALAAARRDPVPAAPADTGEPEPESIGLDAATVAVALSGFSRGCAESRDALRDQVNALLDAWPR
jgi:hypothetical protein